MVQTKQILALKRGTLGLIASVFFLYGCASQSSASHENSIELPPLSDHEGRIVFLGRNSGWYGLLGGGKWKPVILINNEKTATPHGDGIYFIIDRPPGMYEINVDEQDTPAHTLSLDAGEVHYVEMLVSETSDTGLNLRLTKFILRFSSVVPNYGEQSIRNMKYQSTEH